MDKKFVMYGWFALLALLTLGVLRGGNMNDVVDYPVWITEAGAIFLCAFFLYRPNNWTALGAFGGSIAWLVNQLLNWYGATLGGIMQNNIAGWTTVYLVTAVAVVFLVYLALVNKKGSAPIVGMVGGSSKAGLLAFAVMGIFGFWKVYINTGFALPVPSGDIYSRVLWGLGVGIMGFGTAFYFYAKAGKKNMAIYAILLGLVLAAIAAGVYGRGLSLVG